MTEKAVDSLPVIAGALERILILYPVPVAVPAGMVMLMVPLFAVDANVPTVTGEAKLPEALDNSAV